MFIMCCCRDVAVVVVYHVLVEMWQVLCVYHVLL